jgi:hypothetical protein
MGGKLMARLERPFYFIVVLWGERFRNYFLRYCLPSLLSPGNIPALSTRQPSKFLIATRPDDWEAMKTTRIFQLMERHIVPVYIEIPAARLGTIGIERMSIGHKLACAIAHRDKAYATILTPDCMLSEGTVSRMHQLAENGVQLVLTAALRFGEEPFLGSLERMGLVRVNQKHQESGTPLSITGRQMVTAAINGFHPETLSYEWGSPYVVEGHPVPAIPAVWWRVPSEDGLIVHSMSWAPLLLDFGAVEQHDSSTLDTWTIDGDYIHRNRAGFEHIHLVQDSDEMFIASWAPLSDRPFYFEKRGGFYAFLFRHIFGWQFAASFYSSTFDPFKRRIFFQTARWHSRPLNEHWTSVEKRIRDELLRYVGPETDAAPALGRWSRPSFLLWAAWYAIAELTTVPRYLERSLAPRFLRMRAVAAYLLRALQGDRNAFEAILRRLRR